MATIAMCLYAGTTSAQHINAGSGDSQAFVSIVFDGGSPAFVFEVGFNDGEASVTKDLLDIIMAEPGLGFTYDVIPENPPFVGERVREIIYGEYSNLNDGYGDDIWHYWTAESEVSEWVAYEEYHPMTIAIQDGMWAGYVFNSLDAPPAPAPEPVSIGMVICLGAAAMMQRRRNA